MTFLMILTWLAFVGGALVTVMQIRGFFATGDVVDVKVFQGMTHVNARELP